MIVPLRQQVTIFWQGQSKPQRITMIVLLLAAAILVPVMLSWANTPTYSVAFSGLTETAAGQITDKLKASNIPYQVRDMSTIMVPSNQVYDVRLSMASQGIPANSTVGFEVFSQNTLGMTEFTQKVNYQRALEGELERTIASLDSVETVRVHIVTPEKSLFSNDQQPATSSVTLKIKAGKRIDGSQVNAITNLIANSVEGMKSDKVVIVDTNGKMLTSSNQGSDLLNSLTQADNHQQLEQLEAKNIQAKVQSMLDSVLGANHSSVQASVLMNWDQHETTSQTYSPTPGAVRSSKIVNETNTLGGASGGIPGAASNLPTPVATVTVPGSNTLYSHNEQTYNYEITQIQSKEVVAPGQIKRVSISVMVDGVTDTTALTSLKTAVAAAAGIDPARGDTVAVESMAFDRTIATQQEAADAKQTQSDLNFRIGEMAAGAIALFGLLIFVMKLFSNLRTSVHDQWKPVMLSVNEISRAAGLQSHSPALAYANSNPEARPGIASGHESSSVQQSQNRMGEILARKAPTPEDEQLQKLMGQLTEDNPATVAEIIQMWLSEDEKRHA